ncbi:MAG: CopD family protein [Halofilum sp. (in: g-proteobacteria)]|nr:CopD family protein [Halofilum sp. (in: g-proteobacteria)]
MIPLSLAVALHALAAVVWVGGMMFAYAFLRPVAGRALEGPARLAPWRVVFCPLLSGRVGDDRRAVAHRRTTLVLGPFGGFGAVGQHIHAMHGLALVMAATFAHLFFAPWKRFRRAVDAGDHEKGAAELARIGRFVAVNLVLGLIVVVVATGGRYWY